MKIVWAIAFLICLLMFGWSALKIYDYFAEINEIKGTYDNAQSMVQIDAMPNESESQKTIATEPNSNTNQPEATEEVGPTEPESIYKHLHINVTIDWETLHAEANGLVGWLYIPDTNMNYPLVKAADNDYYLNRDYTGRWTSGGSIFLDARVDIDSENVVIYGHNMKADIMFHRLPGYMEQDYAKTHKYIYIATNESVKVYEVFAVVRTDFASDTYTFAFDDEMTMQEYVNKAINNSAVDMDLKQIEDGTQLIALSTCSGRLRTERIVVHAALIDEYVCEKTRTEIME
jgi:sortase B